MKIGLITGFSVLIYFFIVGMVAARESEEFALYSSTVPYDLLKPDETWYPGIEEISGIISTQNGLAVIQDELARIDFLSTTDGTFLESMQYGTRGDFEDITQLPGLLLILRSDGLLVEVNTELQTNRKIETDIPGSANPEGLWFDPVDSMLWVASKFRGKNDEKKDRTIYRTKWVPGASNLNFKNHFELKGKAIAKVYNTELLSKIGKRINNGGVLFQPSAISRNPITNDLWILSAEPPGFLVTDDNGSIKIVAAIPSYIWPQAEGMTFTAEGTLLVASEKTNAIYVYKPR